MRLDCLTDPVSAAWNALAGVIDPELYLDVVSLGLVYGVRLADDALVVEMTMTTPGCRQIFCRPLEILPGRWQ
jgi:metal-sulfur cluster biosynthetic enzyme